jgi:hypothetical protein
VGGERLRRGLRRADAARRPLRRPPGAPSDLHRRDSRLHAGLAARRVRHRPSLAARRPRRAGRRRGNGRSHRAIADRPHLPGGPATGPRDRRVRGNDLPGHRGRADRGRSAGHLSQLAVGVLRECAHRAGRGRPGHAGAARAGTARRALRPARRGHRHGRGRVAGVRAVQRRHHPRRGLALGRHQGGRGAGRRGRAADPRSG